LYFQEQKIDQSIKMNQSYNERRLRWACTGWLKKLVQFLYVFRRLNNL